MLLRQAESGEIVKGTEDGQSLVWNEATQEWEPGSGGTTLPDGEYQQQPLAWDDDAGAWAGSASLRASSISNTTGEALALVGFGSILTLAEDGPSLNAAASAELRLLVDFDAIFRANATGLAFFGAAPVARPSIVGATTQEQVDSIVAALAALGLATDAR